MAVLETPAIRLRPSSALVMNFMIFTPLQTRENLMGEKLKLFLVPSRARMRQKQVNRPLLPESHRKCANLALPIDHSATMPERTLVPRQFSAIQGQGAAITTGRLQPAALLQPSRITCRTGEEMPA